MMPWIALVFCIGGLVGYIGGWCRGWLVGVGETEQRWADAVGRADDNRRQRQPPVENIPEFHEPRFWPERSMHGWGVFYRQDGRKLGVGCVQNASEAVARNVAKALNDVVYDEVSSLAERQPPQENQMTDAMKRHAALSRQLFESRPHPEDDQTPPAPPEVKADD